MENKSKELSELLGIAPKWVIKDNLGKNTKQVFDSYKELYKWMSKELQTDCRTDITENIKIYAEKVNINFEAPENFVKLLEACRTWNGGLDFSFENDYELENLTVQQVFIKYFLFDNFEENHGGIGEHERFKNVLREINWSY